jgi:hypothetical protein
LEGVFMMVGLCCFLAYFGGSFKGKSSVMPMS